MITDLDTGPDVFETPDVPQEEAPLEDPEPLSSGILRDSVNPVDAFKAFASKAAPVPDNSVFNWTPQHPFALKERLKCLSLELEELEKQVPKEENEIESSELLQSLQELQSRIKRLTIQKPVKILLQDLTREKKYPNFGLSEPETEIPFEKAVDLEQRITNLEKRLGIHLLQDTSHYTGNVMQRLDELSHQLTLLSNPNQLDQLTAKVKGILQDTEKLAEFRRRQQLESNLGWNQAPNEQAQKIQQVYDMVKKVDSISDIVPPLVSRLHTLKSLHTQACLFSDTLQQLKEEQAKMGSEVQLMHQDMDRVLKSLESNKQICIENVSMLMDRLNKLV